jgi:BirA family biotin operon repressor/biotin-[acetyl-CoA-carboxylase] ligase
VTGIFGRLEHFPVVGSTNDVVRDWLATGEPEVCMAVADAQLAGRGRHGRTWASPAGCGLLVSVGTRPTWIEPSLGWRIGATVSLAAAAAAEDVAGLPPGTIRLKWPNDLVVVAPSGLRKLGGVLAESTGLGGAEPCLVVGLGVNVDWEAGDFPADLAGSMTSLRVLAGEAVSRDDLLGAFRGQLEPRLQALRGGRFEAEAWAGRQQLPGAVVRLEGSGDDPGEWRVLSVDGESGALLVADPAAPGGVRAVTAGEAASAGARV